VVARGFVQIPGVDFNLTHSPVATDMSVKVILVLDLYFDWEVEILDIEAAFLEAELDESVYIQWPDRLLQLGLVTSAEIQGAGTSDV
jgi:Reverse transcriptase (RNA-dependent DNA polymerase)